MLTVVNVVLHHHQANVALEQSSHAISDFLGPSPFLSLSDACKYGSIPLLDWIWDSSCTRAADRNPGWTLTNYLRSDPHYQNHQFAKSLEAAASRGDVAMMEWLFAHFPGCEAPEAVAYGAKEKGYLRVLHCLLAHKSPPYFAGRDSIEIGEGTEHISDTTTFWTDAAIKTATENGELVECLKEGLRLENCALEVAIKHALALGDFQLAEQILPIGRCLLDYAAGCPTAGMIKWMLDCGYLRRDEALAASALPNLARCGHLDLAQQVVLLYSPFPGDIEHWETHWAHAIDEAGICGQNAILRWLVEHPMGSKTLEQLSNSNLFSVAAKRGHVDTMDYLYKQGLACNFREVMREAINGGQANSVKWLLSNHSFDTESISSLNAIHWSAEHGHLEVLKVFHRLSSSAYEAEGSKRRRVGITDPWWSAAIDPMYLAATGGQLAVIKWLHTVRKQKCEDDTMDIAAGHRHLEVVKWLHVNRSEGCTVRAMNWAAQSGHLDVLQWLHSNRSEGCTSRAIYEAARSGHLETVKWLYGNCPESHYAPEAIDSAIRSGHLGIACWLQQRFPEYKIDNHFESHKGLVSVWGRWDSGNAFEVLLYLHSLANYEIASWFLKNLRRLSDARESHGVLVHLKRWLQEHYSHGGKYNQRRGDN